MLRIVLPDAAVEEVRRNLKTKLPELLEDFDALLKALSVGIYRPTPSDRRKAALLAHPKDIPIMAAALGSGAMMLVTHNVRHFKATEGLRVVRPRQLVEEARAWMARLGR